MSPRWIDLPTISAGNGALSVGQAQEEIPFPIRRFFFIRQIPEGAARGGHAVSRTEEAVFCLQGSCTLWLFCPDGTGRRFDLCRPDRGVYIPQNWWVELTDFRGSALLLALASTPFDETEYGRRPEDFFHARPFPDPVLRPRP